MKRALIALASILILVTIVTMWLLTIDNHEVEKRNTPQESLDFNDRIKTRIARIVDENAGIVGVMAFRRHFDRGEMPVFYVYTNDSVVDDFVQAFWEKQQNPELAVSSADMEERKNDAFANDQETLEGRIRCVPIAGTSHRQLVNFGNLKTVCVASLPPYKIGPESKIGMLFFVSVDVDDQIYIQDVKNEILALQVGIKDFELSVKRK